MICIAEMSFALFNIDKDVCLTEADALLKPQYWLLSMSLFESLFIVVNTGCCSNAYIFVSSIILALLYTIDIFAGVAMAWQLCLYGNDMTGSFFVGLSLLAAFYITYRNVILVDEFYNRRQRLQKLKVNLNEGISQRLQKRDIGKVEEVYIAIRS